MYSQRTSTLFYNLRQKYYVWIRNGDFYRYLEQMNFEKKRLEDQKKILGQAKKLLVCQWEDPYFAATRKYEEEYYLSVWVNAPLYGTEDFAVERHHIRTTTAENIKRRFVIHRGETHLSDIEVFEMLMGELKQSLKPNVPKVVKKIRKEISDFIQNWS